MQETALILNEGITIDKKPLKDHLEVDRGADVMAIQRRLQNLGYFKGWILGIYNDDLKYAVHRFQKDKGLPLSNTINKRCWEAMGFLEFE